MTCWSGATCSRCRSYGCVSPHLKTGELRGGVGELEATEAGWLEPRQLQTALSCSSCNSTAYLFRENIRTEVTQRNLEATRGALALELDLDDNQRVQRDRGVGRRHD